jgi:hypothetical protein
VCHHHADHEGCPDAAGRPLVDRRVVFAPVVVGLVLVGAGVGALLFLRCRI